MNQKEKYFSFLGLTIVLIIGYMFDRNQMIKKVKEYEMDIYKIDIKLKEGSEIMDEVNTIRQNLIKNINTLSSYAISGSQLLDEIQNVKTLANRLDINIKDLEIDPRNTLPETYKNISTENINLERQTLSFDLVGDFLDIGNFVETLENSASPLKLKNCSISLDSLDPRGVIAKLQYVAYGGEEL